MRFIMLIDYADGSNGNPWEEEEDRPHVTNQEEAEAWAQETVAWFNETLRPNERPRKVVSVRVVGESTMHQWIKISTVTQAFRQRLYDVYRCQECGITGRRYGLSEFITRDNQYRSTGYADCRRAQELLAKKNA